MEGDVNRIRKFGNTLKVVINGKEIPFAPDQKPFILKIKKPKINTLYIIIMIIIIIILIRIHLSFPFWRCICSVFLG